MKRHVLTFIALGSTLLPAQELAVAPSKEAIAEAFTDGKPLPVLETAQKVLAQFVVPKGKDTMIYRRVSAPAVAEAAPEPKALAAKAAPSAEVLAQEEARLARSTYLSPSIVVYPQGVTEIKWADVKGASKRVFAHSALEFLPLSLALDLEDWVYGYSFFNWGNGMFGDEVKLHQLPPDIRAGVLKALALPSGHYAQMTAEDGKFSPITEREAEALDALLAYYALNQTELVKAHVAAVAKAEAWAKAKRLHEAQPKTYEIRVWKNQ